MAKQTLEKGIYISLGLIGMSVLGYFLLREQQRGEPLEEITEEADFTIVQDKEDTKEKETALVKVVKKEEQKTATPKKSVVAHKDREPNDDFPLQLGSKGARVKELQVYLLRHFGWVRVVTDVFDQITKERVERYLKVSKISKELFEQLTMSKETTDKKQ